MVNLFCVASSRFNNKQTGSLQEPWLKDVDLKKGEQSESLAAACSPDRGYPGIHGNKAEEENTHQTGHETVSRQCSYGFCKDG